MENLEKKVLEAYNEVIQMHNLEVKADINNLITKENGFDSLTFVDFIIALEEKLDINLDSYIMKIRQSKVVKDIIDIISESV